MEVKVLFFIMSFFVIEKRSVSFDSEQLVQTSPNKTVTYQYTVKSLQF